jgi:hypothetical protein
MQIEYICHACLSIDTGDLKIATDPWFEGPAYCGQWNVFPKPVNTQVLNDSQVILLSHGHEDHFHPPTLRSLPKSASVWYPYTWYGGVKSYLRELGFHNAEEAPSHETIQLTSNTSITYVVNNLDSIVVIESKGNVFVNINDALHSYPPKIVDTFVQYIRQRWPRIDTMFCGFGGASYFPNTVHCPGKNDLDIAETREQMFVHVFCQIAHGLQPRVAVPFAADFVLLGRHQRWINNARFPRSRIPDYYREVYGESAHSPRIHVMYPGDALNGDQLQPNSPYRSRLASGGIAQLLDEQYGAEIAALETKHWISSTEAETLQAEVLENLRLRAKSFDSRVLKQIVFSLRVSDIRENPYFNIDMKSPEPSIHRSAERCQASILEIEISSEILRHSFASDWGGDAITIGYGCEVHVLDQKTVEGNLDTICVQLLTRIPSASRHWRAEPIRMARYVLSSPINRGWLANATWNRVRGKPQSSNDYNDQMRAWLLRTKCEVCRACDLPMLDEGFTQTL